MSIKSGDRVYLHLPGVSKYCYRLVRSVKNGKVQVFHLKQIIDIDPLEIRKVVVRIGRKKRGKTELSRMMYLNGVKNEELADKSGYSVGTVDRARRGIRVKPATLQDLKDSVALV